MRKPTTIWLLPVSIGCGLSMIHILPNAGEIAESAIRMDLPESKENWRFQRIPPSEAETRTLAADTEFSKAVCVRPRAKASFFDTSEPQYDRIDFSLVLSGHDLNNSIHRPERCMPAQGHNILSSSNITIDLPNGRKLTARRLRSVQSIPTNPQRSEFIRLNSITYYFFIGHDRITHDHLARTLIDMKDRLLRGMDQRWAYATASSWFGEIPGRENPVSEADADEQLIGFIRGIAEQQIDWAHVRS